MHEGNIGIGTDNPLRMLHVQGDIYVAGEIYNSGGMFTASGGVGTSGVGASSQWTTDQNKVYITGSNVGIGTIDPQYRLHVQGESRFFGSATVTETLTASNLRVLGTTTTLNTYIQASSNLAISNVSGAGPALSIYQKTNMPGDGIIADFWDVDNMNVPKLRITDGGSVGIGTATPRYPLHVQGTGYFSSNLEVTGEVIATGDITAFGTVSVSDARLKDDITPMTPMLASLLQLNPVSYKWSNDILVESKKGMFDLGLIAQEVEPIFPHIVSPLRFPNVLEEYKGVRYEKLVPILIKAVQEVMQRIDKIEQRLADL